MGRARLNCIERQQTLVGITWIRPSKAQILGGEVTGIVGMCEVVDEATALPAALRKRT